MSIRHLLVFILSVPMVFAQSPAPSKPAAPPATLRSILLSQLRSTHDTAEWFVPVNAAVAGLTPEQAKWVPLNAAGKLDPDANHSVGMLAYHLLFWNARSLAQLKGEKQSAAPSNNDETFNDFDAATWSKTVHDLDAVLTSLEQFVEQADDATLAKGAATIAHISTHNAYHTGQILYVRKLQGSWNPANGVK
ncbi:MAG: DinB family protein [Acidobacteriaceae bacterium]